MKRWTGPAVVAALVAGALAGTGLHVAVDRPASHTSGSPATSAPSGSPISTPSGTKKKTSKTPSSTASSSDSGPAFTQAALLTVDDLMAHGWGATEVTADGKGLPDKAIVRCTGIDPGAAGRVAAYHATYKGAQTAAAEIAARYKDVDAANIAAGYSFNKANQCDGVGEAHTLSYPAFTQAFWFNYAKGEIRGVVAAILVQDRLLVFSMSSTSSDPAETTDVNALLTQAGKRLI